MDCCYLDRSPADVHGVRELEDRGHELDCRQTDSEQAGRYDGEQPSWAAVVEGPGDAPDHCERRQDVDLLGMPGHEHHPRNRGKAASCSGQGIALPARFEGEAAPSTRTATIGKGVSITGQIYSKEDLIIDGEVEGTIEALENKITIGPNGKVKAAIKAKDIVVLGIVQGNVEATERMEIRKDARLVGDIKTTRISIEDGAIFKGSIDIVRTDVTKPVAKPAMQPQASSQAAAGGAGSAAAPAQQPLAANDMKR